MAARGEGLQQEAFMAKRRVLKANRTAVSFSAKHAPALVIDPGETIIVETNDSAYQRLWRGENPDTIEDEAYNPVTGPIFVRGAEPGDALEIDILGIEITRAWALCTPGFGPLGDGADRLQISSLPLEGGFIRLSERLSVPLEPMVGCIGLAPARGESSTFLPAYPWGGNMDLRELSPGATLALPVQVSGGLLSLGDVHAAMGQAEPVWISIEAAGRVTLCVRLRKALPLLGPRIRIREATIEVVIGSEDDSLEDLQEIAVRRAYDHLQQEYGLSPLEAYTYCCARVGLRLGGPACPIVLALIPDPWPRA
jgi:amidase